MFIFSLRFYYLNVQLLSSLHTLSKPVKDTYDNSFYNPTLFYNISHNIFQPTQLSLQNARRCRCFRVPHIRAVATLQMRVRRYMHRIYKCLLPTILIDFWADSSFSGKIFSTREGRSNNELSAISLILRNYVVHWSLLHTTALAQTTTHTHTYTQKLL